MNLEHYNAISELLTEHGRDDLREALEGTTGWALKIEIDNLRAELAAAEAAATVMVDALNEASEEFVRQLAEARKPDCLLCKNYYERADENDHSLYRGCALRLRLTPSDCINGSEFISVGPVRLYEKE